MLYNVFFYNSLSESILSLHIEHSCEEERQISVLFYMFFGVSSEGVKYVFLNKPALQAAQRHFPMQLH